MKKTWKSVVSILLAFALVFSLSLGVLADEDESEENEEEEGSEIKETQTITIVNPQDGSTNVIQNVDVKVEVDVENESKSGDESGEGSESADQAAVIVKHETLKKYCDITGSARISHDWTHVYAQPSIYSKILETVAVKGGTLEIVGRAENSSGQIWYKVKLASGITGYIQSKYLLIQDGSGTCETGTSVQATSSGCEYVPSDSILPAGVTVEVTYVPEVVYVPQITYVPKLIYVTPEPTPAAEAAAEPTPAPEAASAVAPQ